MKIYNREKFMKLPAGTIYAKGKPWYFDGFNVKGDTFGNDFSTIGLMWIDSSGEDEQFERLDAMLQAGDSYPMIQNYQRDGCYNDEDIFLVPERADLERLRSVINAALEVTAT